MNDHTQRIIRIMQDKKMNASQFAEAIGIQRGAMSHIMNGRNNPSADVITKIIDRFEDVDPRWLLTGTSTMKIKHLQTEDFETKPNEQTEKMQIQPSIWQHQTDIAQKQTESRLPITEWKQNPTKTKGSDADIFNTQHENTGENTISNPSQTKTSPGNSFRTSARQREEVKPAEADSKLENNSRVVEKEIVIYKEKPAKAVEKVVLFYSDQTYEILVPEMKKHPALE